MRSERQPPEVHLHVPRAFVQVSGREVQAAAVQVLPRPHAHRAM
jgi:hypothetical protein